MAEGDINPFALKRKPRSIYVAWAETDFVKNWHNSEPP